MDKTERARWDEILDVWDSIATRIELCRRYLRDYPEAGHTWLAYGLALSDVRLFDAAAEALKRGLELSPKQNRHYALADLGKVYQRRGDSVEAERFYREAIAADPDDSHGYTYLGALMARQGRLEEAEATHRRGTRCSRGSIDESYLNIGYIQRAQGRYEEAIASFQEAIRIDPHYKHAKIAMKDCQRAIRILKHEPALGSPPQA